MGLAPVEVRVLSSAPGNPRHRATFNSRVLSGIVNVQMCTLTSLPPVYRNYLRSRGLPLHIRRQTAVSTHLFSHNPVKKRFKEKRDNDNLLSTIMRIRHSDSGSLHARMKVPVVMDFITGIHSTDSTQSRHEHYVHLIHQTKRLPFLWFRNVERRRTVMRVLVVILKSAQAVVEP